MGKKQKRLAEDQANGMPLTRAQVIMRDEMLRGPVQPTLFDDEIDDETPEQHEVGWQVGPTRNTTEPTPLSGALDSVLGKQNDRPHTLPVRDIVFQIIDESSTIRLGMKEWAVVQEMLEKAVRVGFEHGGRAAR